MTPPAKNPLPTILLMTPPAKNPLPMIPPPRMKSLLLMILPMSPEMQICPPLILTLNPPTMPQQRKNLLQRKRPEMMPVR